MKMCILATELHIFMLLLPRVGFQSALNRDLADVDPTFSVLDSVQIFKSLEPPGSGSEFRRFGLNILTDRFPQIVTGNRCIDAK